MTSIKKLFLLSLVMTLAFSLPAWAEFSPLGEGSSGDQVTEIQNQLIELGYLESVPEEGTFDKVTQNGIIAFQVASGLQVTGIVDENTYKELMSADAGGQTEAEVQPETAAVSSSGEKSIREIILAHDQGYAEKAPRNGFLTNDPVTYTFSDIGFQVPGYLDHAESSSKTSTSFYAAGSGQIAMLYLTELDETYSAEEYQAQKGNLVKSIMAGYSGFELYDGKEVNLNGFPGLRFVGKATFEGDLPLYRAAVYLYSADTGKVISISFDETLDTTSSYMDDFERILDSVTDAREIVVDETEGEPDRTEAGRSETEEDLPVLAVQAEPLTAQAEAAASAGQDAGETEM